MSAMEERLLAMLEQGHDNLLLRFGLGKALTESDKPQEAITHLLQAVEFDSSHASSWFWLGRAYLATEQYPQAQEALDKAEQHAKEKGEEQTVKMAQVFQRRLAKQQGKA